MNDNCLKVNDKKTQLIVLGKKFRRKTEKEVHIQTTTTLIKPSTNVKLLGCNIHENLKWNFHILDSFSSLKKALSIRVGSLKRIRRLLSFKTRKMMAECLFMSKRSYMISLWGGCSSQSIKELQVVQNKVTQIVTGSDWSTSTKELLRQCGWLSVHQLSIYHSVLLVHRVKMYRVPKYLYDIHNGETYLRVTRQAEDGKIKLIGNPRLELSKASFRWRAADAYNSVPKSIRDMGDLAVFKKALKTWIQENIEI